MSQPKVKCDAFCHHLSKLVSTAEWSPASVSYPACALDQNGDVSVGIYQQDTSIKL